MRTVALLGNGAMSPLFLAVVEATEEAVHNSLVRATTVTECDGHVSGAIPIQKLKAPLATRGEGK